jgi:microcystin-dependent protein
MSDPFVAEIRIFAGNFAPRGWAKCEGQTLPIAQNTALFSLLGITYGGDGKTTFALPNLRDRVPMHTGTGPGLTPRQLGENGGAETVTLLESQIPQHTHTAYGTGSDATAQSLQGNVPATGGENAYSIAGTRITVAMSPQALSPTGGSAPHNNLQPYLVLNFIIALEGIFPPRP